MTEDRASTAASPTPLIVVVGADAVTCANVLVELAAAVLFEAPVPVCAAPPSVVTGTTGTTGTTIVDETTVDAVWTGQSEMPGLHDVMVYRIVEYSVDVTKFVVADSELSPLLSPTALDCAEVTGTTMVERDTRLVLVLTGQFVTSAAQLVMVYTLVA